MQPEPSVPPDLGEILEYANPVPEASNALGSIEGCFWAESGPWCHVAGHRHFLDTGHQWVLVRPS